MRLSFGQQQIVRFLLVGILNTIVGYGTYYLCIEFNFHYFFALIIANIIGIIHSFFWNKLWTFKTTQKSLNEAVKFVSVYGLSFLLNSVLLFLMVDILNFNSKIAGLYSLGLVTIISFVGHKFWSFKSG